MNLDMLGLGKGPVFINIDRYKQPPSVPHGPGARDGRGRRELFALQMFHCLTYPIVGGKCWPIGPGFGWSSGQSPPRTPHSDRMYASICHFPVLVIT